MRAIEDVRHRAWCPLEFRAVLHMLGLLRACEKADETRYEWLIFEAGTGAASRIMACLLTKWTTIESAVDIWCIADTRVDAGIVELGLEGSEDAKAAFATRQRGQGSVLKNAREPFEGPTAQVILRLQGQCT